VANEKKEIIADKRGKKWARSERKEDYVKRTKRMQKKGKKIGATYLTLIKRALKKLGTKEHKAGVSVPAIVKYLLKNFPEKSDRRHVRVALAKGVQAKSLVQTRLRFRLSAKEQAKSQRKKKSTAKKSTKTATKRKASDKTTKKSTKKAKTTKKSATKKATTKKATTKKSTKKSTTKKVATKKTPKTKTTKKATTKASPQKDATTGRLGTIAEGAEGSKGVWQYYDNAWHDYYPEASGIVEGIYQEYKQNPNSGLDIRAVKSGHFQYSVDFNTLQQKNIETGTIRNIQRRLA